MIGDSSEQSGNGGFLAGIVVLVLVGITFAMIVNRRFEFSSGQAELEEELQRGEIALEKLKFRSAVLKEQWTKEVKPFEGQDARVESLAASVRESTGRVTSLIGRRDALKEGIVAADQAFRADRDSFRQRTRAAAAGEKLAELKSRKGRAYVDVTIKRVTAEGVEIEHAEGLSRLRPEDLDDSWRERFQWHPEEQAPAPAAGKSTVGGQEPAVQEVDPALPSAEELAEQAAAKKLAGLRRDVTEALRFLGKAEAELARARAGAQTDQGRPVPVGSETREEKLKRMEATLEKFRERYVAARGRLAAASPNDAVLRDSPP